MRSSPVLFILLLVLSAGLWVVNCSGPRPSVEGVHLTPPANAGDPYVLEATVRNQGWGHGEVNVVLRLVDQATHRAVHEERRVALEAGEAALVVARIDAPPAAYSPQVEVEYPPR